MPVLMILLFWPNAYFHEKNHHLVAFLLFFYCLFYSLSLFFWVSWGLIWTSSLSIYFKWWPTVQILLNFFLLVDKNHFGVLYGHIKYVNILQFLFEIISNFFFAFLLFWESLPSNFLMSETIRNSNFESKSQYNTKNIHFFLNEMEKKPKYDTCIINSTLGFRAFNKYIFVKYISCVLPDPGGYK